MLKSPILHDDRKPLRPWIEAQQKYTDLEARKLRASDPRKLSLPDRLRMLRIVAPTAVLFYCLIVKGGVLDGWPGFYYAFQRMFAEVLLSLNLLEHDLKLTRPAPHPNPELAERRSLEQDTVANAVRRT